MKRSRRIIRDNTSLYQQYDLLEAGDIICCRIRLKPGEEHLMLDLAERGVIAFPSFRAQLCCRSKTFQTRLFSRSMLPRTMAIYSVHDLLPALSLYGQAREKQVIVKRENKNGGLGVFLFNTIEDVYTQAVLGPLTYPFVVQPFAENCRDVRTIIIDDFIECYERSNPHNFRHNLHCGGTPKPYLLSDNQRTLCREIMERGGFPYAHIDLMVAENDTTYFTEINLRGGLRGARISSRQYRCRIEKIHDNFRRKFEPEKKS